MKLRSSVSSIGAAGVGTGAALTATLASACCVGPSLAPIAISVLGASGLIALTALRPYTPLLLLGATLMLAFSFRQIYSVRSNCLAQGASAPVSRGVRFARIITWIAAFLWLASVADSIYGFLHE